MIYTLTLNPAVDKELSVASIEFDSVLRATDTKSDFGGKGFNVSRMLRSLGTESVALGFAGGKSGQFLREGLESLGIKTDFIAVNGETRTNVSIVTESHDHYVKVNEPGPTINQAELEQLLTQIRGYAKSGDLWVLAGSLPPGLPIEIYATIITILNEAGARVILDTSGPALELGCKASPFLVKPNDEEIHKITGLPVETEDQIITAARALIALGVENVVVSMGKKGALGVTKNDTRMMKSPVIQERNPIGAGDSLVGGLAWGLHKKLPLIDALAWGIACGAASASMDGTEVGPKPLVEELHQRALTENNL